MGHAVSLSLPKSERDLLLKTADARLYPSISDPNFLVLRARRLIFQKWICELQREDVTILDIGGRYQPYRRLFDTKACRYIACDVTRTELVDVVGNGESLPFGAETFDVVVATQVFDYFAQPHKAAEQIRTVLKPGGWLMMSVASVAPRFRDDEYWRFTPKGIRGVLSDFSRVTIVPELTSIGGVIRTANLMVNTFAQYGWVRSLASVTSCPFLNLIGLALEELRITSNDQFTPNYSVLAVK